MFILGLFFFAESAEFKIQALKRKEFTDNFAYLSLENVSDNHEWNNYRELSNQHELQPLVDTPLEKSNSAVVNNDINSDISELRVSEDEGKSIISRKTNLKTSQNEQKEPLIVHILASPSSSNFPFTKTIVRPASSRNEFLVTEAVSNRHTTSIHNIQKVEPSKGSFSPQRNSFPHSVENKLSSKRIDNKEILVTSRATLKSSSKANDPEHAIPPDKKISTRITSMKSSIVDKSMAQEEKILSTTTKPLNQEVINRMADDIEVRFEVLEDLRTAEITLRNKGSVSIERGQWSVHFCITTGMELGHLAHRPEGYVLPGEKSIKLTHFNGCAYKLEPTRDFKGILPGNSLKFKVHIGPTLARSDLAPRWYVAADLDGLEPRVIANTADETLDFLFLSNRKKPWDRFANNDVADLGKAPLLVIPTPLDIVRLNESKKLVIDGEWIVFGEPGLEEETSFLAGKPVSAIPCKCLSALECLSQILLVESFNLTDI